MSAQRAALVVSIVAGACVAACSSGADGEQPCELGPGRGEAAPQGATSFVAFSQHFGGFHAWRSTPAVTKRSTPGFHGETSMTVYLNRAPAKKRAEFPVGTVIVKETSDGPLRDRSVFAMVKRGGGFNASGAAGWEWFELDHVCGVDEPVIRWRGIGPPAGEKYGGDPNGCNACHALAADNDFVMSDGLRLSAF